MWHAAVLKQSECGLHDGHPQLLLRWVPSAPWPAVLIPSFTGQAPAQDSFRKKPFQIFHSIDAMIQSHNLLYGEKPMTNKYTSEFHCQQIHSKHFRAATQRAAGPAPQHLQAA